MEKHDDLSRDIAKRMGKPAFAEAYHRRRLIHGIATAVRSMRESAGLSQTQLAKMVGTSQPNIARLETSQHNVPQWDVLNRIAWALGRQLQIAFVEPGENTPPVRVQRARKRSTAIERNL